MREREKQPGREGAGGLVALHNTRWSSLERRTWCELQQRGELPLYRQPVAGAEERVHSRESREEGAEPEQSWSSYGTGSRRGGERHKGEIQEEES